jgi:uncharacterized protein YukE
VQFGNDFLGMNIEEVRQTAGSMEQQAELINGVLSRLTSELSGAHWTGPDADKFKDSWANQHAPAIRKAAGDIRTSAGQVRANIEAQIQASRR